LQKKKKKNILQYLSARFAKLKIKKIEKEYSFKITIKNIQPKENFN
jgi:hypothetical protein